jgi:ribosomal protein S24E
VTSSYQILGHLLLSRELNLKGKKQIIRENLIAKYWTQKKKVAIQNLSPSETKKMEVGGSKPFESKIEFKAFESRWFCIEIRTFNKI